MLFDTTQLALERSISGAAQRHEALAANIANATTPGYQRVDVDFHGALAAAMGSSDARSAIEHTGFTTQADRTVGADARRRRRRSTSTPSRPSSPPTRSTSRLRSPSPRPATRSCVRPWVSPDEHVRRHGDLRERAHRAAPADERHGREPGQRADHARRRRSAVPAQGSRPPVGGAGRLRRPAERRDGRRRRSRAGGVEVAAVSEDQTNGKLVYDPSHPDANDAGLRDRCRTSTR